MPAPIEILTRTFVHVPGIGRTTERSLWESGITSWQKFLDRSPQSPFRSRPQVSLFIEHSLEALTNEDSAFFGRYLPRTELWRLIPQFEKKTVFLDIETTGLSPYYDEVTLVGLYDGRQVQTFIAGHNLEQLPAALKQYDLVVTFNGTLFDLPFLKAKLPNLQLPQVHLDLRFILKRLGHSGGLKLIEQGLGLRRNKHVQGVDGFMATVLWARYLRGDLTALEQLIQYNAADITSLHSLLRYSYQQLAGRLLHTGSSRVPRTELQQPKCVRVEVNRVSGSGVDLIVDQMKTLLKVPRAQRPLITLASLLSRIPPNLGVPKVVGIDLRASEDKPTGWALLVGNSAQNCLLKTDREIIRETIRVNPDVISIDSPLTLPLGRCCIKDSCRCRVKGILRVCERTLWRRGVRVFPCLLPSMQKLTERGIRLAQDFRKRGYKVIESYPGAAQDIMRIPRKRASLEDLAGGLASFGVKGVFLSGLPSHDELDAITSALVGYFYLSGDYEGLGNEQEDYLIIPRLDQLL
jgi:uncharacterized protein YprB with RNaseH-like and TPR domain/predicted nuclease with RNAse H fold